MKPAASRSRRMARVITLQYLLVLGVLGALSLAGYVTFIAVTSLNEGSATEINVSGRQRMLSQRIAFYAWRLSYAESESERGELRWEMRSSVDTMKHSHMALIDGDEALGLSGHMTPELRSLYFGPTMFIDRSVNDFLEYAQSLLDMPDHELSSSLGQASLRGLSMRAGVLVHSLDTVVRQYQADSESRAVLMTRIATVGLALTLLVLLLAGLFVFAPLVRRVRAEMEELDQTQERHTLALQGTNEGLWDWDIEADRVYLSPRLRTIFRIDESERFMTGKDWVAVVHPEDRPGYLGALRDHLKGLTSFFEAEYRLRRGGDNFRWVRQRGLALRREDGLCYRMAGSVGDITERRRDEEELRLAASVFANSPEAIMVTDAANNIRDVNPAFTAVTGYTRDDAVGQGPSLLSSGRHGVEFYKVMWRDLKEKGLWSGEIWNRRKNGEVYPQRMAISTVRNQAGAIMGYIAQFSDIGREVRDAERLAENARELARKNVELEDAVVKANAANRAKSEFLAAMSHELRTPLNAVIGFSEAMLARVFGAVGDARYEGYLENIRDSGRHLLDVINDILDVSKVEAGKIELYEEEVDVTATIDATVRLVRERAEKEGIALVSDIEAGLPLLTADGRRLKQILLNLLSNAIKFTNPGGKVEISAITSEREGLIISVADNGIGIAAQDLAKIMTPFTQVDSQLSRRYEGTGLGLPLTKGLVEAHGGSLEIVSELGEGTTVTVRFPGRRLQRGAVYSI